MERELVVNAETTPPDDLTGTPFEGLDVRTLVGADRNGAELCSVGQTRYPADGATHEAHRHPHAEELVVVLEGQGEHQLGDDVVALGPGDVVLVPKGMVHAAHARGGEDMVILWVLAGAADLDEAGYEPSDDEGLL